MYIRIHIHKERFNIPFRRLEPRNPPPPPPRADPPHRRGRSPNTGGGALLVCDTEGEGSIVWGWSGW